MPRLEFYIDRYNRAELDNLSAGWITCLCYACRLTVPPLGVVGRIAFRAVVDGDEEGVFHNFVRLFSVGKDNGCGGHSVRSADNFCVFCRKREKMKPENYDIIEIMFIFAKESSAYLLLSIHSYP